MSDELAPAEQQDTQVSPEETPQTPEADSPVDTTENNRPEDTEESFSDFDIDSVPEEYRDYVDTFRKSLQADYTRKRQADSETVRQAEQAQAVYDALLDEERALDVLSALGYSLAEDDDDEFELDEDQIPDPNLRVDELEQSLAQREEQAQLAQAQQLEELYLGEQIEAIEDELGREFSQEETNLLAIYANQYRDQDGLPDVRAASAVLDGVFAERQRAVLAPKANAPRQVRQGATATRADDLSTEEGRMAAMERAAARAMGSA
ncbi:MAG: hypothetical protein AB7V46_18880 [Thermomicrobiales bacterium]